MLKHIGGLLAGVVVLGFAALFIYGIIWSSTFIWSISSEITRGMWAGWVLVICAASLVALIGWLGRKP